MGFLTRKLLKINEKTNFFLEPQLSRRPSKFERVKANYVSHWLINSKVSTLKDANINSQMSNWQNLR